MSKKLLSFISFAAMVLILVVTLKVVNWLPTVLQEGIIKKYSSIDEVKSKLAVKDIFVPSYFPQRFSWPPSIIMAQTRPFAAVVMEFNYAGTGDTALVISQAADRYFMPDNKMALTQIKDRVPYSLKGRNAILEVGTCKAAEPCSRISWSEGKSRIMVVMKSAPFELIKIAESMLR